MNTMAAARMPCANTIALNQYQARVDAEEGENRFIEEYVASRLEDRIIKNATPGDVYEAIGEELEAVMDAYNPALRAFHGADMTDQAPITAEQETALCRLGWAVLKYTKDYISANTDDELSAEARSEMKKIAECASCSGRRRGKCADC